MIVLGLGGILKGASCAVLSDGHLAAAIEAQKVDRHWEPGTVPAAAIAECLRLAGAAAKDVDCLAVVRPFADGSETALHLQLRQMFPAAKIVLVEHQTAHAASAYYPSGFDQATVLTQDRSGDLRCGARFHAAGANLRLEYEQYLPDSLGDLFSRTTEFLGFEAGADEHKVQWLSTAGDDQFVPLFEEILMGGRVNPTYFDANRLGDGGFSSKFYEALGLEEGQKPADSLKASIARGLQRAIELRVLDMAGGGDNLCLAGGLFFNALLVAAIERSGRWKNVFVQPVSGNAGTAVGAVYHAYHAVLQQKERVAPSGPFLGPSYEAEAIKTVLENCKLRFHFMTKTDDVIAAAIERLKENRIIAWMQGRMEFGPRALGNRSILASPLDPYSTENLNVFIKHREPFRKFAASVPAERAAEFFEVGRNARYLSTVGKVRPEHRERFRTAILGDDFVRVHLVEQDENPLYHKLLIAAGEANGLPVLYNTSFNLFGDPLVCTPRDAVRSFYSSGIDALFVGNFLVEK